MGAEFTKGAEFSRIYGSYCISCYFREGFIFANFASQTLAKISTSIHVYNDNIRKIVKLTTRELPHLVQKRENNYSKIMAYYYTVVLQKVTVHIYFNLSHLKWEILQTLINGSTVV